MKTRSVLSGPARPLVLRRHCARCVRVRCAHALCVFASSMSKRLRACLWRVCGVRVWSATRSWALCLSLSAAGPSGALWCTRACCAACACAHAVPIVRVSNVCLHHGLHTVHACTVPHTHIPRRHACTRTHGHSQHACSLPRREPCTLRRGACLRCRSAACTSMGRVWALSKCQLCVRGVN